VTKVMCRFREDVCVTEYGNKFIYAIHVLVPWYSDLEIYSNILHVNSIDTSGLCVIRTIVLDCGLSACMLFVVTYIVTYMSCNGTSSSRHSLAD